MSARDDLFEIVLRDMKSSGGDWVWTEDLLDAYRAEVLNEAADTIEAACPDGPAEEVLMDCACDIADLIRDMTKDDA